MKKIKFDPKEFMSCFQDQKKYILFMEDLEVMTRSCILDSKEADLDSRELHELQVAKMTCLLSFLMRHRETLNNLQEILLISNDTAMWYLEFIKKGVQEDQ